MSVQINGTGVATTTTPGGGFVFVTKVAPITVGATTLDFTTPIPLAPAQNYFAGELVFVEVEDQGQNGDPFGGRNNCCHGHLSVGR